jgi:hypothetical protein
MKKALLIFATCLLGTLFLFGCGDSSPKVVKPETQYTINKNEVPKADPNAWAPGSKRQVSYWVQVPKETSQEQVKKIAEYIIETEAKPLKNWNVAWFVFVTPEKQNSGFATALYTKNAKISDGNQVKPGKYDDFAWEWTF